MLLAISSWKKINKKLNLCYFYQEDDDEEIEDMTIKPTDAVIVCARNEDEVSHLEACI